MVALKYPTLALSAAAASLAAPTERIERSSEPNFELDVTLDLVKRQNYTQDYVTSGTVNYSPSSNGYSVTYSGAGDFVVGKGWSTGSTSRAITFSGSTSATAGTNLVSLYGWSTNPLVEYYVQECYTGGSAGQGTVKGTLTSDGSTYTVYEHQQVNQPSIQGTTTFSQYISVRSSQRCSGGTITFANHVKQWASYGMNLGTMNYQTISTEGWGGASGSSNYTVSG
ncbi:glycosyl hydrolases family 11 domain-containing protein [Hirsutella rhossiliensis]|uniref:Endo-1,4-beta-xylanase n=1 Tax=Hirsutella rhossiliensis TaxID=111463 RepID=A0A9P8SM33_9HYPO|nr:glycosyl hydrolases family 11 domain-containing protein [Hirsutella rhossiliensis]KAH0966919.1 glycosyl hydrolases family 11 domain-containing protein [Hirsutella rhossiliensis]